LSAAFSCPRCRTELGPLPAAGEVACPTCGDRFPEHDGVWDFLLPERRGEVTRFLEEYTAVRHAEGRGSDDPTYYRALPDCADDHPLAWQWRIRRATFVRFRRRLGPPPQDVADLGAGVGWLSARLARDGHRPVAVDLSVDPEDGLGAARHYGEPSFPRLRADFDRLPFADASLDVVVFNASFHYSADYDATVAEALRVLRPEGEIVILDSPVYRREASGEAMVAERKARFRKLYGFPSDALGSREFLTDPGLEALAARHGFRWERETPWYGWSWALRPWRARLRGRREPSRFVILRGRRAPARAARAAR